MREWSPYKQRYVFCNKDVTNVQFIEELSNSNVVYTGVSDQFFVRYRNNNVALLHMEQIHSI